MAISEFLDPAIKDYAEQAKATYSAPINTDTFTGRQFVAGQDPAQTSAYNLATQGVGSYSPYLQAAQTAQTAGAGALGQSAQTVGGLSALTGPQAYQPFMSPYQSQVIDATLTEYDKQGAAGEQQIKDQAVMSGNFGGGREGVERANYQTDSNRNRAALQAQLLGQGFGQAQAAAGQAFGQQSQLATLQPALAGQTVAGLQAAGSSDLAYRQAGEDARRQAARLSAYEPYERTSYLASGLGSLGGMTTPLSPAMTGMSSPQMSPLQTALSLGTTLGGIYGSIR